MAGLGDCSCHLGQFYDRSLRRRPRAHRHKPAAFATAALGTYGDLGSRNVQGPGSITINTGVVRQFRITEAKLVEWPRPSICPIT